MIGIAKEIGPVNSDHAHALMEIVMNGTFVDLSLDDHLNYLQSNKYIYYDSDGFIHRMSSNATLGILLKSIGLRIRVYGSNKQKTSISD